MDMNNCKTIRQLESAMMYSTVIYEMVNGRFGPLPVKGTRGPRSGDGGLYTKVHQMCDERFGRRLGGETIFNAKQEAIRLGAVTLTPQQRVKKVEHACVVPSNTSAAEKSLVDMYRFMSNRELCQKVEMHYALVSESRKRVTGGILKSFNDKGTITGRQRFALVMTAGKDIGSGGSANLPSYRS